MKHTSETGKRHRIHVVSLGCPKNLCDTESMMGQLAQAGHTFVDEPDHATAVLINTCAFIAGATAESHEVIDEFAERKRLGELDALVVTGCLAQRDVSSLREQYPDVDAWLGTGDCRGIKSAFAAVGRGETYCQVGEPRLLPESDVPRLRGTPAHYAYLRIADGCSNCCSYCIIPQLRGAYTSRSIDAVLTDAFQVAATGARELILVAQDVTRFGVDRIGRSELPVLLERLSEIDEVRWIRLMYAYPTRVDDDLVEAVGSLPKVLHYLDMPIQHAATRLLRAMNRPYSRADLRRLIRAVRCRIPDIALRTTVMVGFPGETVAEFDGLLRFMDEIKFDRLGGFCYSPENGTPATAMGRHVDKDVKRARLDAVMRLQQRISLERNRALVGNRLEVVVDETAGGSVTTAVGRSYRDAPEIDGLVYIEGYDGPAGRFIDVDITEADVHDLYGRVAR